MPPPRYHFPSRPWPDLGPAKPSRLDASSAGRCRRLHVLRHLKRISPPFRSLGVGRVAGNLGRFFGGVVGVAPWWCFNKNVKTTAVFFFSPFLQFLGGVLGYLVCLFFIYLCVLFLEGALDKWNLTKFDFGFLFEQLGGCSFTFPLSSTDALGARRFGFWKEAPYERDCYELWKRYPYWIPNRAPNPHQLMHPGLHGYMFLFYLYIYIYIYSIYTVYIDKQPILPPIILQIKWKFLKMDLNFQSPHPKGCIATTSHRRVWALAGWEIQGFQG